MEENQLYLFRYKDEIKKLTDDIFKNGYTINKFYLSGVDSLDKKDNIQLTLVIEKEINMENKNEKSE